MSASTDLLIVGAGAKAAAIAAKVHVLNELGLGPITLLMVEAREPAASWLGRNGFTTGREALSTSPTKDVGFPYQSSDVFGELGTAIDRGVVAFSWQQYLMSQGRYARWVDAGSPPVEHREYGQYLAWVLTRATRGVRLIAGRAMQISLQQADERWRGAQWTVDVASASGVTQYRASALALTGPGAHRPISHDEEAGGRVFHCDSRRSELAALPVDRDCEVAVVGGGESALACVLYLRQSRPRARLSIYTPHLPMSRAESFLENRIYSNPEAVAWSSLHPRIRRDFVARSDRGVFAPHGLAAIATDPGCHFRVGRVGHIEYVAQADDSSDARHLAGAGEGRPLRVEYEAPQGPAHARHDYLVNCTGFDVLGQLRALASPATQAELERQAGPLWGRPPAEIAIGRSLELAGVAPLLHLPGMAALSQGPGFTNLSSLGLLANRVIAPVLSRRCHASDSIHPISPTPFSGRDMREELTESCY